MGDVPQEPLWEGVVGGGHLGGNANMRWAFLLLLCLSALYLPGEPCRFCTKLAMHCLAPPLKTWRKGRVLLPITGRTAMPV